MSSNDEEEMKPFSDETPANEKDKEKKTRKPVIRKPQPKLDSTRYFASDEIEEPVFIPIF